MDELDLYRIADTYTLVDAAALLVGEKPSRVCPPRRGICKRYHLPRFEPLDKGATDLNSKADSFDVALKSLLHAVEGGTLPAKLNLVIDEEMAAMAHVMMPGCEIAGPINPGSATILADDLREWLTSRGVKSGFFFPEVSPLPASDAALIERLRAAETARDILMRELAALSNVETERDNLREQTSALADEVGQLTGSLDAAGTRIRELSGNQAQGKSRTAMLRLIGGLAMSGHGIDIHGGRLEGIGQVISDMASKGVSVSEQMLRDRLKEAAKLIDRLDPK
ncbi:hypothetical protein [Paraburkholderia ginsengisoli]|uniref:Uncharacterized protein n=1 Tax=Paraburkholderia ginsengisoli TaxID=311231 RepID=A0A7T4N1X3_9BURK|nr:hypothetical protein [Paraburkholderia ginsengisoli]QQC63742.1 hypothetical protein I6I06_15805 [Paraburkholderia ginsengisoli]